MGLVSVCIDFNLYSFTWGLLKGNPAQEQVVLGSRPRSLPRKRAGGQVLIQVKPNHS